MKTNFAVISLLCCVNWFCGGWTPLFGSPVPHPADTDADFHISTAEVSAYNFCWKTPSCVWPVPPNPIPTTYVSCANFIWKARADGAYHYDPSFAPPLCWVPGAGSQVPHPADLNADFRISTAEVSAYNDCWKTTDCVWPNPPNPIPTAYVSSANYIWKSRADGAYHYVPGTPPQCWVSGPGTFSLVLEISPNETWAQGSIGQITVQVEQNGLPQTDWTVTGTATPSSGTPVSLTFARQTDTYSATFIPPSAGTWTVDVTAEKGGSTLAASSSLVVVAGPSISVTISGGSGSSPVDFRSGDTVHIAVDSTGLTGSVPTVLNLWAWISPSKKVLEYTCHTILSAANPSFPTDFPALPVFCPLAVDGYATHELEVIILSGNGLPRTSFPNGSSFIVKSSGTPQLGILTSPEWLERALGNWSRLKEIMLAARDCGLGVIGQPIHSIFILDGGGVDRQSEVQSALRVAHQTYFVNHLLILGGDAVIPYAPNVNGGPSDHIYWDIAGDADPDLRYGRLPTSMDFLDQTATKDINYDYLKTALAPQPAIDPQKGVIYAGRDGAVPLYISDVFNLTTYSCALDRLNARGVSSDVYDMFHGEFPYATWSTAEEGGRRVQDAEIMWVIGHGNMKSVFTYNGGPATFDVLSSGTSRWEVAGPAMFALTKPLISWPTAREDFTVFSFYGQRLLGNPLVYLSACLAGRGDTSLAAYMSYLGAIGCAAYGIDLHLVNEADLSNVYLDNLPTQGHSKTLGDIHHDMIVQLNHSSMWDYTSEFKNLLQFGNPIVTIQNGVLLKSSSPKEDGSDLGDAPTQCVFQVTSYQFLTNSSGSESLSLTMQIDGSPTNSSDWMLQGNPVLPFVTKEFLLPAGLTLYADAWLSVTADLGQHRLAEMPATTNLSFVEFYPLGYSTYMPEPVSIRVIKQADGRMVVRTEVYPVQYTVPTTNLLMHSNIVVTLQYTNVTAQLISATASDTLVKGGEPLVVSVVSTGTCEVAVSTEAENGRTQTQTGEGTNIFVVATTNLAPGSHTCFVRLRANGALNDETAFSFSVYSTQLDIDGPTVPQAIQQGTPLRVSWEVTNAGVTQETANVVLECHNGDSLFTNDCGFMTLASGSNTIMVAYLPTENLWPGMASLRVKASVSNEVFWSSDAQIVVTILDTDSDSISDIWEQQIVDADPNDAITNIVNVLPGDDFDGDGLSNLQEYLLGKKPLVFDNWRFGPSQVRTNGVEFTVIGKPDGCYTLETSTNLMNWTKMGDFYCAGTNKAVTNSIFTPSSELLACQFFRFAVRDSAAPITLALTTWPTASSGPVLALTGEQGRHYTVFMSTNLVNWQPLTNFTSTKGTTPLTDPAATNYTHRFYRAMSP